MDYESLRRAPLEDVLRLASFVGATVPKKRGNEGQFRHALANAILRAIKRGPRARTASP